VKTEGVYTGKSFEEILAEVNCNALNVSVFCAKWKIYYPRFIPVWLISDFCIREAIEEQADDTLLMVCY
jgi:hypothetical protein